MVRRSRGSKKAEKHHESGEKKKNWRYSFFSFNEKWVERENAEDETIRK